MRPSCVGTFLLTILLAAGSGCQQTSGPTAGTPTTPIGPLAPNGTGSGAAGPRLGPFGAPTRVPPPATGSYGTPNNYLGGAAPGDQARTPRSHAQNFASVGQRLQPLSAPRSAAPLQPVGSGVRQTGWSDNGAAGLEAAAGSPESSARAPQPQLGGLPVNDLTGAPPPPGYAPSQSRSGGNLPPTSGGGAFRGYRQPSTASSGTFAPATAARSTRTPVAGPRASSAISGAVPVVGSSTSTAAGPAAPPAGPSSSALPASRGGGQATTPGPSTEPASEKAPEPNLPWRRPGSQY